VILLIFLTVGIGLAVPYVVLSWNPALLKFLPKPGAWMERFKIAMGFPDAGHHRVGCSCWLPGILTKAALFGLDYSSLPWAWRLGFGASSYREEQNTVAWPGSPVFFLLVELELMPFSKRRIKIEWQSWNPAAVAGAQAAGRPVLVDFTADWCVNCQVNKKIAIEVPSVRAKLKSMNAVALLGDYTHFTNTITAELNRFNRAGVPLVLVYPKNHTTPPIVLPEILTPGIVVNALDRAAQ